MNILVINNNFPPEFIGGYELGALDICHELVRSGHSVRVLTSPSVGLLRGNPPGLDVQRNLQCLTLSLDQHDQKSTSLRGGYCNLWNLQIVAEELASFKPDAVYCFNLTGLGAGALLFMLVSTGHRPIVHLMDDIFNEWSKTPDYRERFKSHFPFDRILSQCLIIAMSRSLVGEVEHSVGTTFHVSSYIPGWVTGSSNKPRPTSSQRRFIYAGRIAPHKGMLLILEAAASLASVKGLDFVVDYYGLGELTDLHHQISAYGLGEVVRYRGAPNKPDMLRIYSEYDALLFPTWEREPFGFVATEAAAAGCIPILTALAGASEWLLDGSQCFKIRRSSESLSAAMERLCRMSEGHLTTLRRSLATRAQHLFSIDRHIMPIHDLINTAQIEPPPPDACLRAFSSTAVLSKLFLR